MTLARREMVSLVEALLASPRFAWALSIAIISTALFYTVIEHLIGVPGTTALVVSITVVSALTLIARRRDLEWQGLLPISLLAFLAWSALSLIWSRYQGATLGAIGEQFSFALLGVTIALTRDWIQIVRAVGDCLRVAIGVSLALEILVGIIFDSSLTSLGLVGNLAAGGPIQGVMGSRNQMGLVALIALITFAVELRTRSVTRLVGTTSVVAAGLTAVFTQSPVVVAVAVVVATATGALAVLRRVTPERRLIIQAFLAISGLASIAVVYLARGRVIEVLNGASESEFRIDLWRRLWDLASLHPLEGWGWIGAWDTTVAPFFVLQSSGGVQHHSALNAYIDVWFQLGAVGFTLFVTLILLTLTRAWILASRQQSSTIVWGALVMIALATVSLAESAVLTGFGWLTLVICSVRAAQQLSWRRRFARASAVE